MSLNIFGAAGNVCVAVNPHIVVPIRFSTGSTDSLNGSPVLTYSTASVEVEIQAVSSEDLKQIENISQQADMRSVYVFGVLNALNRPLQVGGDILTFYGSDWLVTQQLEEWGDGEWTKVLVTRQITTS